ncbi:two-component system sensor histidine kinase YesM [Paenibacillus sp. DS2015]|uniref:sensor histidine kinase n=1 Tax=Paenibacillus sp. DS2015 TaxID=3373917 RepID=UPI003D1EFA92
MRSFRSKLFFVYSMTLITLTLSVSFPMYFYFKNSIKESSITSVEQLAGSTASNLSSQLNMFSNMTFQFYNSYDINRSTMADYLTLMRDVDDTQIALQARKSVNNFMMIATNTYKSIDQLNLYTANGELFFNRADGVSTRIRQVNADANEADATKGGVILTSKGTSSSFTLMRKLQWRSIDLGYLEAILRPNTLIDRDKSNAIKGASIVILDHGRVIYTSEGSIDEATKTIESLTQLATSKKEYATIQENSLLAVKQITEDANFMVVTIVPEKELFAPLRVFRNAMTLVVILLIVFSVAFYYLLAKLLTRPITSLKHVMDGVTMDDEQELHIENKYKMNEIESLRRSFQKMNARLKKSADDKLHFQTLQLKSHFQTLQAQINPHFLFNMLGVITIMADKKDSASVADTSRKLSEFMRYAISAESSLARLQQEINFTENYLKLMKTRYMHRLDYELDIPTEMGDLLFPKLTIQPIVENCIQHGLHEGIQQVCISVRGKVTLDRWEIVIVDNGTGFSEEALIQLNQRIQDYMVHLDMNEIEQSQFLVLGGMGLISTLARLKLTGKGNFTYSIGNHDDGGAVVSLRGLFISQQEELK